MALEGLLWFFTGITGVVSLTASLAGVVSLAASLAGVVSLAGKKVRSPNSFPTLENGFSHRVVGKEGAGTLVVNAMGSLWHPARTKQKSPRKIPIYILSFSPHHTVFPCKYPQYQQADGLCIAA
jgi:hypothetical protein